MNQQVFKLKKKAASSGHRLLKVRRERIAAFSSKVVVAVGAVCPSRGFREVLRRMSRSRDQVMSVRCEGANVIRKTNRGPPGSTPMARGGPLSGTI